MKQTFSSFLIVGFFAGQAIAQCSYFRLSADLLKCEAVDAQVANAGNPYQATQDLPGFEEPKAAALIEISCACEYSLSGSNPVCDLEQTIERSSVVGVDNVSSTCRKGKILCRDVCPPRLP